MNVLSKAIKVSAVFARRDGWRFDDHDEKLYIDPEWTVLPLIWQTFTHLFALLVFIGENVIVAFCFFSFICYFDWQTYATSDQCDVECGFYGHHLWNIASHHNTWEWKKWQWEGEREGDKKGVFNMHPDWLQTYTPICSLNGGGGPFPLGSPHVSTACPPWLYLQSKTLKRVH